MSPNLTDNQMVLAFKGQQLEHGDVITFNAAKVDPKASLGTLRDFICKKSYWLAR